MGAESVVELAALGNTVVAAAETYVTRLAIATELARNFILGSEGCEESGKADW